MKKQFLTFCLIINYLSTCFSQVVTIKDQNNQESLEGVVIISKEPSETAVTDDEGKADVADFFKSEKILIQSIGYKPIHLSFEDMRANNFLVMLEPTDLNLNEIVISATKWQQTSNKVPSKIVTISSKNIQLQNPQTAADLLGVSGKVFIQKSQQGGGSPMIRGFATNRLVYTVDGIRMNTAIFRGGNIQNVINLDPFSTESTEVLMGSGSVIYGSDAIGGVMSFQTLTPKLSARKTVQISGNSLARYSSANQEKTGHFDVHIGWEKWASVTSISHWNYGNLKQGRFGPDDYIKDYYVQRQDSSDVIIYQNDPLLQIPSAYTQLNVMQKLRYHPNQNWDFQYGFHFSETSPFGRYDRHNRTRNGTARYGEWDYGPQSWMMNNFTIKSKLSNLFYDQLIIRIAQQNFKESRISRNINTVNREVRAEQVNAYSINADFTNIVSNYNDLFYGIEYVRNDVLSDGMDINIRSNIESNGPSRYPNATWSSLAAYINDEFEPSDALTLQAGIRYNHYRVDADFSGNLDFFPFPFTDAYIQNGNLTGSVGGVYQPNEKWSIKVNSGTAFRAPNVDDIGKVFDSEPGAVVIPNPTLNAEYAYNFDIAIAKIVKNVLKIDLAAYYTILENAMVLRNSQLNNEDSIMYDGVMSQVQTIQNASKADVYGVQMGFEMKLPSDFSFSTDLNYQLGKEELDDGSVSTSRHAAPFYGVSRVSYKSQKLNLQLYIMYQAERKHQDLPVSEQSKVEIYALDKNGNTYSPAWYTLNFKVSHTMGKSFTVNAGIENITNRRYRSYSSGISGAGRNFILSVKHHF